MHRALFVLALVLVSSAAFAQQQDNDTCPDGKRLRNLCMYVSEQVADPEPLRNHRYKYQRRILEAACVDVTQDSEETQAGKVSAMWRQLEPQLVCNSVQFDVVNGSILKLAAIRGFDAFINDAIRWQVPLNKVDDSDGRTLLDYLQYHMDRNKTGAIERQLSVSYQKLRKAGARHSHELPVKE